MGKLTCSTMLGFLALHLGEIFFILATATPEWLQGKYNVSDTTNATIPDISKGLWRLCGGDNCTTLNMTQQSEWFHSVQGLQVPAVGFGMLALIITYVILLMERCRTSAPLALANTAAQTISAICGITAVAVFGAKALGDISLDEFPMYFDVSLAWSFYVDIAAVVFMVGSALLSVYSAVYHARSQSGYENI